ncbi:hypothetical protein B0919_16740 [Hymenobacter sp. CRA2]|nr:hypothetical protein B0919_16740 [Hymenobacter sp. CRA2]
MASRSAQQKSPSAGAEGLMMQTEEPELAAIIGANRYRLELRFPATQKAVQQRGQLFGERIQRHGKVQKK